MSAWLSIAITVILIVVAYVILNRNIASRTSQQAALDEIKREVGAILTELNSASERNIDLIEDRIRTLETLIEEADRRINVMRRESTRDADITYKRPTPRRPVRIERPTPPLEQSEYEAPLEPEQPVRREPEAPSEDGAEDVASRIERLYLQGFPLERIASIVGRTLGEVELIISLREGSES